MIVSRRAFEEERERRFRAEKSAQGLARDVAHLIAERDRVQAVADGLLKELLALRREGFDPPSGGVQPTEVPEDAPKMPPLVLNALSTVATPGTELYERESIQAQALLDRGMKEEDVERQILDGGTFSW